jgi:2-amino-4-hydroxy-6-hydroxymethyldihydropteridine diphosphokinase
MATVYLALGSNQGQSIENIKKAIKLLDTSVSITQSAPFYRSHAIGYTDQPDFINTAILGNTNLEPLPLLKFLKQTEQMVGRIERFRWGPREIDIDIIFYDDLVLKSDELTIPHPEFKSRDFVLQPICDINPNFKDPLSKHSIQDILDKLSPSQKSDLKRLT